MTERTLWSAGLIGVAAVAAGLFFGFRFGASPAPAVPALPAQAAEKAETDSAVEKRPAGAVERGSAHPAQAFSVAVMPSGSAESAAAVFGLGRTGLSAEELFEQAKLDPELAWEMSRVVLLCSMLSSKTSAPGSRWAGSGWAAYREQCARFPWQELHNKDFGQAPKVESLLDDAVDLPEGSPELKSLTAEVLAIGQEMLDLQYATTLYFDAEHLRALTSAHDLRGGLRLGDVGFQIDLSLYVGCQFSGRGCAWDSSLVLMECMVTGGCSPGMSMPQIIALRRSPLEMELIRLVAEDVAQMRRAP